MKSKTKCLAASALALVLCGCGPKDILRVDGKETDSAALYYTPPAEGRSLLSFCVAKGEISNSYSQRNATVKDSAYYQENLTNMLKADAPFKSIEYIGDSKKYDCDVVLTPNIFIYVAPLGQVQVTLTITARPPDGSNKELFCSVVFDKGSLDQAAGEVGRYVFNAFAPGTALYNKISAQQTSQQKSFAEVAKHYVELAVKPDLPEAARKFQVQAEAAFHRKDFEMADTRYRDALEIAPWWPEGHFNRALILGETGKYKSAIEEMNKYLLLVPDAPDARAANDKIYEWEDLFQKAR